MLITNIIHIIVCLLSDKTKLKKHMKSTLLTLWMIISSIFIQAQTKNYVQYVNPFIGTGGHGHTFPGATVPFGMVQLSPDTRIDGSWDGVLAVMHLFS